MARDTSRRGTPRGRALPAQGRAQSRPRQAARPAARSTGRPAARPAARPQRAPKAKAATGRPAFLDNAVAARRGAPQGGKERRERYQRGQSAKAVVGVVGGVAALTVVLVVASVRGMAVLAERAFAAGEFVDTAYFEPFYLKDFVVTTSKKKLF